MSASYEEFQEILSAETILDMEKMRSAALHGIPNQARSQVWLYLLGVLRPDKSKFERLIFEF
jgi:hypothetical protein